jgi:diguanylate cyclase (GGDEF)-like protein/PAS domain S-box-containing protein
MGRPTNELFREIVSLGSQAVLVVDVSKPHFRIAYANRAYEALSGFPAEALEGTPWLESAAMDESAAEFVRLTEIATAREPGALRFPFFGRNGDIWAASLKLTPLKSGAGTERFVLVEHTVEPGARPGAADQAGNAFAAQQALASLERTDAETGLLSGTEFRLMLKRELAVARRGRHNVHLMLFSIPELDVYRETFGAAAADSCIRMIGAQIAGTFRRASDLSARIGASTLAVSVTGQEREQVLGLVAQVERKSRNLGLHNPRGRLGRYIVVQGVTVAADPATDDVDGLMARAEAALYARSEKPSRAASGSV